MVAFFDMFANSLSVPPPPLFPPFPLCRCQNFTMRTPTAASGSNFTGEVGSEDGAGGSVIDPKLLGKKIKTGKGITGVSMLEREPDAPPAVTWITKDPAIAGKLLVALRWCLCVSVFVFVCLVVGGG